MTKKTRMLVVASLALIAWMLVVTDSTARTSAPRAPMVSIVCDADSPSFQARNYWRDRRTDTTVLVLQERADIGLADVPVDSIEYVLDESRCGAALESLRALAITPDSSRWAKNTVLISWGGLRYIAPAGAGWAVMDTSMVILHLLTEL